MVHDERLQPGVPRAPLLGGAGVDDRAGEGDVTGVAQHVGEQPLLVVGAGQGGHFGLDRLDRHPYQFDQAAEGDGSDEVTGSDPEHVPGQFPGVLGTPAPLHERGDPGLHHQLDVGPVPGRHGREPGQDLVHAGHRAAGEHAAGPLDPPDDVLDCRVDSGRRVRGGCRVDGGLRGGVGVRQRPCHRPPLSVIVFSIDFSGAPDGVGTKLPAGV